MTTSFRSPLGLRYCSRALRITALEDRPCSECTIKRPWRHVAWRTVSAEGSTPHQAPFLRKVPSIEAAF